MHLHQELEGFYLGGTPYHSGFQFSSVRASKVPRVSTGNSHSSHVKKSDSEHLPKGVILILEDFDEIRSALAKDFFDHGYEVFSSATLRDALAIAFEELPQVILINSDLRGDTSIHAITRLHDAFPQSCIILVGEDNLEERASIAGALKVIPKSQLAREFEPAITGKIPQ